MIGEAEGTGTKTSFLVDRAIMETDDYDYQVLAQRFREMAYLNRGLWFSFTRSAAWPGAREQLLL